MSMTNIHFSVFFYILNFSKKDLTDAALSEAGVNCGQQLKRQNRILEFTEAAGCF